MMARIAGIATQKNTKGEITHVTIDVKKHREIITPVLEKLGVIEKSKFVSEWENAISIEEFRERSIDFVKSLPWDK